MASEPEIINHRRYDPSMSKRTRKPQVVTKSSLNQDDEPSKDGNNTHSSAVSPLSQEDQLLKVSNGIHHLSLSSIDDDDEIQKASNGIHRSSLKELMNKGNGLEKVNNTETNQGDEVGGKMKAITTEDKSSLALVSKKGEGMSGAKSGGMVSRYVKVLSHLIKVKRDSKKKSMVRLLKP